MIGHRSEECADLLDSIQIKIKQVFLTENRVLISASSGTGLQEAAIRNCSDTKILNCVNGAFSDRWRKITEANNKDNDVLEIPWGQPVLPKEVVERLSRDSFDAVTIVHNETSTGVTSPIRDIAQSIREIPGGEDIMILVDSVSGLAGIKVEVDAWDLDVVLTSSQKAFALPPGLSFCSVSDRAMDKAHSVEGRGYYFDFLELDRYLLRDQTPYTPPISLLFALDLQLSHILDEGLEERFLRHINMRDMALLWASKNGLNQFSASGYESPTVSCFNAPPDDTVSELIDHARSKSMIISDGYGHLKGKSFRIAHMGDTTSDDLAKLLDVLDEFLLGP